MTFIVAAKRAGQTTSIQSRYSWFVQIVRGQKIAGVPIERVRHLMRRTAGLQFGAAMISHELDLNDTQARRLASALLKAGYLQKVEQRGERSTFYERTLDGSTLASATMAAPLRRATVDRLLKDVVERARAINANDAYAYRVARIALFGSALGDALRPGDVDLAVTLTPPLLRIPSSRSASSGLGVESRRRAVACFVAWKICSGPRGRFGLPASEHVHAGWPS